jgi:hypothetical protein
MNNGLIFVNLGIEISGVQKLDPQKNKYEFKAGVSIVILSSKL